MKNPTIKTVVENIISVEAEKMRKLDKSLGFNYPIEYYAQEVLVRLQLSN